MNIFRRLLCLLLIMSIMLTSSIGYAIAITFQSLEEDDLEQITTGPIADLSEMFVADETETASTPETVAADMSEAAQTEPAVFEPVETELAETEAPETEPAESEALESEPLVTESAESELVETDPTETESIETEPEESEPHNFTYTVNNDGTCVITGYSGSFENVLEIPNTLDGYLVVSIGSNAFKASDVVSVVLPDSITSIGNYAFQNCTALESIELGNSLISIGSSAFQNCTALTELALPDTVTTIGNTAFKHCTSLANFKYPISLQEVGSNLYGGIFAGCTALESVEIPEGVTGIPDNIFYNAVSLQQVTLPSTLTGIGDYAFYNSRIGTIDLPDGLTYIGNHAFRDCTALVSIELGNSLISIGSSAFQGCTALTELALPDTVTTIGNTAFKNCTSLANFKYPINLKDAGSNVYGGIFAGCSALESVEIPEGVTGIPVNMFYDAVSLQRVTLPSTLQNIGSYAFTGCTGLTSMDIPDSVMSIGSYAFQNCTALESVEFGNSLLSIGSSAFQGCTALTELALPDTVTTIGNTAFKNCTSLANFKYPINLKDAGSNVYGGIFAGCSALESVEIPEGVTEIPVNMFYDAVSLQRVTLPSTLQNIGSYAFTGCTGLTSIDIPDSVISIGSYAFQNCTALESVEFGNSLLSIGSSAFQGCTALKELVLPDTVTTIGNTAFKNCTSLANFKYPINLKDAGSNVYGGIFAGCSSLKYVEVPEGVTMLPDNIFYALASLKAVSLPSTLQNIGSYAFTGCTGLTSIDIPDTVVSIGTAAFRNCTGLKKMDMPAALKSIASSAFQNCTSLESVLFFNGVTQLPASVFSGCSNLSSVHMPRSLTRIQNNVFANCTSLKEIYIPSTVTSIANNAFSGMYDFSIRCNLLSYAAEFALDHQIPIIPHEIAENEISSPLNADNSYYVHNYDGLSAAGVMSMVVHYEMQESSGATPTAITIHVYDFASLRENTLTLDGVLCTNYEYDVETGRLTVPVKAASGTLRFCLKPLRYDSLESYARLIYTDRNGKSSMAVIGIVDSLMPMLNISAKTETSESTVTVSGLAVPEEEVSLYVDGTFVKKVKANKVGDYSATVSLGTLVDGKEYVITAEARDRNGNKVVAQTEVLYRYTAPDLVDFTMVYGSRRYSLIDLQGTRPVINFSSGRAFRFEVNFTNAENVKKVYVVSTRNNVRKVLEAKWDKNLGLFVAEGYFDPFDRNYVPGTISLEYTTPREKVSFSQSVDFTSQEFFDTLPQEWKDAQVEVLENSEDRTSMEITVGEAENQVTIGVTITNQPIPQHITEQNIEEYGYTKVTDDYGKTLYVRESSGGSLSFNGEVSDKPQYSAVDFVSGQVSTFIADRALDAFGNIFVDATSQFNVFCGAMGIFKNFYDEVERQEKFTELEKKCTSNPNMSATQKQEFYDQLDRARNFTTWATLIKCTISVGLIIGGALIGGPLPLAVMACGIAVNIIIDAIIACVMEAYDLKAEGIEVNFKWAVDPSGYVYNTVTGERISDVRVHAYWIENIDDDPNFFNDKPGDDEYGVLWDSMEYSQMNPLFTDEEGRYAWDVPEGWWRVSYEKDGYFSTWSEWLPVPPPQTEVNIGMTPLHVHTEAVVPGVDATCTETGLTEGKSCSECGEVLVAQEVIGALGHDPVHHAAKAPSCTNIGWNAYESCSRCDYSTYVQITATGHTEVIDKAVAPTCTETGLSEGKHCSVCNAVLVKQEVVDALGHTEVVDKAVAPTCTATGLTEGKHCSVCNEVLVAQNVVDALGHTEVIDKAVDPTCTATGLTEGKHCTVCNAVLVAQQTVPALGHSFSEQDGKILCGNCSEELFLRFAQDYVALQRGETVELAVSPADFADKIEWSIEGDADILSTDANVVTASRAGTSYVLATISEDGFECSVRFRVDVIGEQGIEGVQLATTKATTELYKTEYTTLDILLKLPQNYSAQATDDGYTFENKGVAIEAAKFTDETMAKYFDLVVLDDRTVQIVPTAEALANAKDVKGSYKGTVTVTVDGEPYETEMLTLSVKKALPKLKASVGAFNSFYAGQALPIIITGATVTGIALDPDKAQPEWLNLEDGKLVLNEKAPAKSVSGKVYLLVETSEWSVPAALTLSVKNTYKVPGVKLVSTSITVSNQHGPAEVEMKLVPTNKADTISGIGITGITAPEGYTVENFNEAEGTFTLKAENGFKSEKIDLKVNFGSTTITLKLTIKTQDVKLKLGSSKVSLNKDLGDVAVVDVNCLTAGFDVTEPVMTYDNQMLDVQYAGGKLTVSAKDAVYGKTYPVTISAYQGAPAVKLNVAILKQNVAVKSTIKATGFIDVIRDGSAITVTPSYTNVLNVDVDENAVLKIYSSADKFKTAIAEVKAVDGVFVIDNSVISDQSLKYKAQLETTFGETTVKSSQISLTVKMGTAKLVVKSEDTTLFSKDKNDRALVWVESVDATLNDIVKVEFKDAKQSAMFEIFDYGNGQFAIGFKDGKVDKSLIGKTVTVNLNVFIEGNQTTKANATANVKLTTVK